MSVTIEVLAAVCGTFIVFSESMNFIALICQKIKNNYDFYAFKRFVLRIPAPSILFKEVMTKRIQCEPDGKN